MKVELLKVILNYSFLALKINEDNTKFEVMVKGITKYASIQFSKGKVFLNIERRKTPSSIEKP
jgi:hypothetical protein